MTDRIKARIATLTAALFVVGAAAACDSTTGVNAIYPTYALDSQTVYTINGSHASAPTALSMFGGVVGSSLVPAGASFSFDIAFDIDPDGRAVLLPARAVAGGLSGPHSVGLQVVNDGFESLTSAPSSGYTLDSALVVDVGDVVAIQSHDFNVCTSIYQSPEIYGKLTVREIDPAARTLLLRFTVDPNCGYRSLAPGVPKD